MKLKILVHEKYKGNIFFGNLLSILKELPHATKGHREAAGNLSEILNCF